jgi:hypothetical protein
VVARGPAAIRLPPEDARASLLLSGPARVLLREPGGERTLLLGPQPERIEVAQRAGEVVQLDADAAIRLHEVRLERAGPPRYARVAALLVVALACLAFALRKPGAKTALAGGVIALAAAFAALNGTLAGLFALVALQRLPARCAAARAGGVAARAAVVAEAGAGRDRADWRVPAGFGALLLASCALQLALYEQPVVAGDPAAYYEIGGRFRDALLGLRAPDDVADAVQTLRPYGDSRCWGSCMDCCGRCATSPRRCISSTRSRSPAAASSGARGAASGRAAPRLGDGAAGTVVRDLPGARGNHPARAAAAARVDVRLRLAASRVRGAGPPARGLGRARVRDRARAPPTGIWFLLAAFALSLLPFARRCVRRR